MCPHSGLCMPLDLFNAEVVAMAHNQQVRVEFKSANLHCNDGQACRKRIQFKGEDGKGLRDKERWDNSLVESGVVSNGMRSLDVVDC